MWRRAVVYAVSVSAGLLAPVAVAQDADPMAEQRCVWTCLYNSPGGAESSAYRACVQQYCSAAPAPAAPAAAGAPRRDLRAVAPPPPRPAGIAPAPTMEPASPAPATVAPLAPVLPSITVPEHAGPRWTHGRTGDGQGMYAEITDPDTGARIAWICGPGRGSFLSVEPYSGASRLSFVVDTRRLEVEMHVENGAGYMPIALDMPLFAHMASGHRFSVEDADGAPIGSFVMTDAPVMIGRAEGTCQAMR